MRRVRDCYLCLSGQSFQGLKTPTRLLPTTAPRKARRWAHPMCYYQSLDYAEHLASLREEIT